ncbi:MAG: putative zinc-binding protein [Promethearchaeota archaeon]
MNKTKVNVLPCSGIGKAFGTISRWAAFEIKENLKPENAELLCLARLVTGDDESVAKVHHNYNITIDGCSKRCAYKHLLEKDAEVSKSFLVAKFLVKNRDLKVNTRNVSDPGQDGQQLAKRIGIEISELIDELVSVHGEA